MSGILNNKERIFDFVITKEGRKQLANNSYEIKFASFTDAFAFYQSDEVSGSADATDRIYLEASSLPQDQITFEADDSGKLLPFGGSVLDVLGGKVLSGSNEHFLSLITGSSAFASLSNRLLSSSFNNFKKLYTIGTLDFLDETNNFILSDQKIKFSFTENFPLEEDELKEISITSTNKFFQDSRLAKIPNFQYLPPKNKKSFEDDNVPELLGNYSRLGQGEVLSFERIKRDLSNKESKTIEFVETSNQNNLHIQFFEGSSNELLKLDIIDFGEILTEEENFPNKHIYFVGKVLKDRIGNNSFFNLFTLIFE